MRTNIQADVTSSSGEEEYRRTLDIINRLSLKYLNHDQLEDQKAIRQEAKLRVHSTKPKLRTRHQRKVGRTTRGLEEACLYDGDIENNTCSTSQSEDASMKSASDDLYDFEQSNECLRLELSPDNKPQRHSVRLTQLQKPSTTCRSKITFSGPKKRNVASNERKTNQVWLNADKKRGTKANSGRKRLHSSEDNADVSHVPSKQRTSIRLASSSVTRNDRSRDDSGFVMSPSISTHLSLPSRSAICTPGLVSTSTPNTAVAMQTNMGSSDDSCFGFKYLMPSVSLVLSPVEASPSSRVMSLMPDDSGISVTPSCDVARPDASGSSTGKTQKDSGMFDMPIEKKPARKRTKKNKHLGPSPEELAAQMNAEFDDLESYELSVEAN